jgi:hypothetical protein
MNNFIKLITLSIVGLFLLTGCGGTEYKYRDIHIDLNNQLVYEKDKKTLTNGSFGSNIGASTILEDGLITSFTIDGDKIKGEFNEKKLLVSITKKGKTTTFKSVDKNVWSDNSWEREQQRSLYKKLLKSMMIKNIASGILNNI